MIAALLKRLGLEAAKRAEFALGIDHAFDRRCAERADQLVFEIGVANEETQRLCGRAREAGTEPAMLETAQHMALLAHVVQAGERHAQTACADCVDKVAEVGHAADRHDDDALGAKITSVPLRQRLDGGLVTPAFDQDRRAPWRRLRVGGQRWR
jgi:hypothetical protein